MNRSQELAPVYQKLLDVFDDDEGLAIINLVNLIANIADERDDMIGRALAIDGMEWRAEA
jgi:hypothetical protein